MCKAQAVLELSKLLKQFNQEETGLNEAIQTLKANYPDESLLASLLEEYVEDELVFTPTLYGWTPELLLYFCQLNPKILQLPFNKTTPCKNETLLVTVICDPDQYEDLEKWIDVNHPDMLEEYDEYMEKIRELREDILKMVKRHQFEAYKAKLTSLSLSVLLDLCASRSKSVSIERLFKYPDKKYLQFLIGLNIAVLRIDFSGKSLLEAICDEPILHQHFFDELLQKYQGVLTEKEQTLIRAAIEVVRAQKGEEPKALLVKEEESEKPKQNAPLPKHPLLTSDQLDKLPIPNTLNSELLPFVNMRLEVDSAVLDAFLFQMLREQLAQKSIALMPTIRSVEAIAPEQIQAIIEGRALIYTTGIVVREEEEVIPLTEERAGFTGMTYAVWPVNLPNRHYGLFILKLVPDMEMTSPRGFYIEPLHQSILLHELCSRDETLHSKAVSSDEIKKRLRQYSYQTYLSDLTRNLHIQPEQFTCLYLSQAPNERYCSDYVIGVLLRLTSAEINLATHWQDLRFIVGNHLSHDMVQKIRFLEIATFGEGYFFAQLDTKRCEKLKEPKVRHQLAKIFHKKQEEKDPSSIDEENSSLAIFP